jgi:hypothetical protein
MKKYFLLLLSLFVSTVTWSDNLMKMEALDGRVSLLAPAEFSPMPKNLINIKYPSSQRPTEVLSDSTGSVTLAFNHTNNAMAPSQVRNAHAAISKMIHNSYPSANWIKDEIIEQNGSTFMAMELITPASDTKIHNIMYGTSVDGRFLLVAFNTTIEKSKKWLPLGKNIMSSLAVNPGKK